jgi:hypothetical protein
VLLESCARLRFFRSPALSLENAFLLSDSLLSCGKALHRPIGGLLYPCEKHGAGVVCLTASANCGGDSHL